MSLRYFGTQIVGNIEFPNAKAKAAKAACPQAKARYQIADLAREKKAPREVPVQYYPGPAALFFPRDPYVPIRKIFPCVTHSHSFENAMPAQTRPGKIIGPYKKRKLDRKPISPYTRMPNTVGAVLGIERKYFDIEVATAIPAATNLTSLTTVLFNPVITLGDEVYQRNGRKVLLSRVAFRGNIFTTPLTGQTSVSPCSSCRLVLWRNDQAGAPAGGFMGLADNSTATNSAIALGLFQSPNANGIGKIVDDKQYTIVPTASVNNATGTTVSTVAAEIPVYLSYTPKKPITLNYQAVAASVNPDKWFTILGVVDAATFLPSLNGVMRFYYTDA